MDPCSTPGGRCADGWRLPAQQRPPSVLFDNTYFATEQPHKTVEGNRRIVTNLFALLLESGVQRLIQ